jgi:hypothetical protein
MAPPLLFQLEPSHPPGLTFFLSSEPFLRSLLAMMTPMRRVSNTGSVRLDCAERGHGLDQFSRQEGKAGKETWDWIFTWHYL